MRRFTEWAEREIALAAEEKFDGMEKGKDFYDDAAVYNLVARMCNAFNDCYKNDGVNLGQVKRIMDDLFDGKLLTPLTNDPMDWEYLDILDGGYKAYQNKRLSTLFKLVDKDGREEYTDIERFILRIEEEDKPECLKRPDVFFLNIVDSIIPITMPYIPPEEPYKLNIYSFRSRREKNRPDTFMITTLENSDIDTIEVNRYFKINLGSIIEIPQEEYVSRLLESDYADICDYNDSSEFNYIGSFEVKENDIYA